jgi:hypothetical protein
VPSKNLKDGIDFFGTAKTPMKSGLTPLVRGVFD